MPQRTGTRRDRKTRERLIPGEVPKMNDEAAPVAARPAYRVVDFAEVPGVPCPCGTARRAFADVASFPGTVHVTEIAADARRHYHRRLTETYFVLECVEGAALEL